MEKKDVRIPQQKRSIEKKEKIIEAAYDIFGRNGYLSTNTAEIAKEAGLSTGSVYAYFNDKKDILLACLNKFGKALTEEICDKIEKLSVADDILNIIREVTKIIIKNQRVNKLCYDEIMSLRYIDMDVKSYFVNVQKTMMSAVAKQIEKAGYSFKHEREQTFLLFKMVMAIEDELAFEHSTDIDHDILIDECANAIVSMLIRKENSDS